MEEKSNWKTSVFIIGGLAGLITGLAAAFLFVRDREQLNGDHKISSGQGVKIGMGVVSLLRMITEKPL
jgi:hypothetical protein